MVANSCFLERFLDFSFGSRPLNPKRIIVLIVGFMLLWLLEPMMAAPMLLIVIMVVVLSFCNHCNHADKHYNYLQYDVRHN